MTQSQEGGTMEVWLVKVTGYVSKGIIKAEVVAPAPPPGYEVIHLVLGLGRTSVRAESAGRKMFAQFSGVQLEVAPDIGEMLLCSPPLGGLDGKGSSRPTAARNNTAGSWAKYVGKIPIGANAPVSRSSSSAGLNGHQPGHNPDNGGTPRQARVNGHGHGSRGCGIPYSKR